MSPKTPTAITLGRLISELGRRSGQVLVTTVLIQAGTFLLLATSALVLSRSQFASLSLIVATTILSSAIFDLGLSTTTTRQFGKTRNEAIFSTAFAIRLAFFPFACIAGAALFAAGLPDLGLGLALGALQNIWNGARATDQARQDYDSFLRSSIAFAMLRAAAGLAAVMLMPEPVLIAVAIYAIPLFATYWSSSARLLTKWASLPFAWDWGLTRYSAYVYVAAMSFVALPYAPQLILSSGQNEVTIATYGVILTFSGAINLIFFSLRSVLLPMMLSSDGRLENALWSRRGLLATTGVFATMAIVGVALSVVVQLIYAGKYPDIVPSFLVSFLGYAATATIGLYSLSVHTRGVPELNAAVSLLRLSALFLMTIFVPPSLLAMVSYVAVAMVSSELLLTLLLAQRMAR
jgi:MFS family permease